MIYAHPPVPIGMGRTCQSVAVLYSGYRIKHVQLSYFRVVGTCMQQYMIQAY